MIDEHAKEGIWEDLANDTSLVVSEVFDYGKRGEAVIIYKKSKDKSDLEIALEEANTVREELKSLEKELLIHKKAIKDFEAKSPYKNNLKWCPGCKEVSSKLFTCVSCKNVFCKDQKCLKFVICSRCEEIYCKKCEPKAVISKNKTKWRCGDCKN